MRKLLLAITATAAVLSASMFATDRAEAMAVAPATDLQAAIEEASVMQDVGTVCRHRYYSSFRRCWWVPGIYYAPRYRYRYWGYRRWRHR